MLAEPTTASVPNPPSRGMRWTGRVLSALVVLFLTFDGVAKIVQPALVVEATRHLGLPEGAIAGIGIVLLACAAIYAIPRTAILGAVLLTGYLGGAIATHVRVGDPTFTKVFPVIVGVLAWGGLWLRDPAVRRVMPVRRDG